jgi:hypothetical protein
MTLSAERVHAKKPDKSNSGFFLCVAGACRFFICRSKAVQMMQNSQKKAGVSGSDGLPGTI